MYALLGDHRRCCSFDFRSVRYTLLADVAAGGWGWLQTFGLMGMSGHPAQSGQHDRPAA